MATFQQTAKWNEFMTKFAWRHKVKTHNIWHWFSRNSMKIPIQTAGEWKGFKILTCNLEWTHYRQEDGENYETKWSNNEFDDNGWATMRLPCKMDFFSLKISSSTAKMWPIVFNFILLDGWYWFLIIFVVVVGVFGDVCWLEYISSHLVWAIQIEWICYNYHSHSILPP